jgi:hemerythrin
MAPPGGRRYSTPVKEATMEQKRTWGAEIELGVASVESEHRLQARLLAVLREAAEAKRDRAVIEEILRRVEQTTNAHFSSEELLMRLEAYDHYGLHVEEHRKLLEQLSETRARFEAEPTFDLLRSVGWFEEWLAGHIQGMDRRFTESVAHGVTGRKPPPRQAG